jgi:hypothetical protein
MNNFLQRINSFSLRRSSSVSNISENQVAPTSIQDEKYNKLQKEKDEFIKKYIDEKNKNEELKLKLSYLSLKEKIENVEQVDVEFWEIFIAEGISAAIHGDYRKITEIYFPDWDVAMNYAHGSLNIVSYDNVKSRYTNKNKFHNSPEPNFLKKAKLSKETTGLFKSIIESDFALKRNKVSAIDEFKKLINYE